MNLKVAIKNFILTLSTLTWIKKSYNICSENISSSDTDSDVVLKKKRRVMQLDISSDSEEEKMMKMRIVL